MMRAQRDGGFVFVSRARPKDLAFQEMAGFYSATVTALPQPPFVLHSC